MTQQSPFLGGGQSATEDLSGVISLPPGRAQEIAAEIYRAIVEHRLRPGMKLSEDEVGDVFDVSRTIVRTALQSLAHGGLVAIERNRGAFVARPSKREAEEVFEARALIEPRVARIAAEAMTEENLPRLRSHIVREHEALAAGRLGQALALSGRFHIDIAEISGQTLLAGFVRALISRSSLVIALYWNRSDTTCERHAHDALITALGSGDGPAAQKLMLSHIVDLHSGLDLADRPPPPVGFREALGS